MESTNLDIEQKVLADPSSTCDENVNSNISHSPEEEPGPQLTFDTGLHTWLQALGSFFLFFNSW